MSGRLFIHDTRYCSCSVSSSHNESKYKSQDTSFRVIFSWYAPRDRHPNSPLEPKSSALSPLKQYRIYFIYHAMRFLSFSALMKNNLVWITWWNAPSCPQIHLRKVVESAGCPNMRSRISFICFVFTNKPILFRQVSSSDRRWCRMRMVAGALHHRLDTRRLSWTENPSHPSSSSQNIVERNRLEKIKTRYLI